MIISPLSKVRGSRWPSAWMGLGPGLGLGFDVQRRLTVLIGLAWSGSLTMSALDWRKAPVDGGHTMWGEVWGEVRAGRRRATAAHAACTGGLDCRFRARHGEEGAYRRVEEGVQQALVELESRRVEIDVDVRVQHQVEVAQREDTPLEQRAVLEVRPAALDRRAGEVRAVGGVRVRVNNNRLGFNTGEP